MTADPDSVAPDVDATAAFASLAEHGYRHIPVVDGDRLVGIVSMRDLMRVAQIQPAENLAHEMPRGLEGVIVAETEVGDVRGLEGFYHYRQYNAVELAEKRSIEDVWYLMFEGALPTTAERDAFLDEIAPLREIPDEVKRVLPDDRAAGATLPARSAAHRGVARRRGARLPAVARRRRRRAARPSAPGVRGRPTLLTALYRLQQGLEPIDPDPDLAYAANYLYMMQRRGPDARARARAVEQYLITTVDHGFNASTFTARVITSTGADLAAAVVGAIGALSGPLHGGAPSRALDMLDAIGTIDNAEPGCATRSSAATGSWASATASTRPTTRGRCMLRSVAERLGGDKVEFGEGGRGNRGRRARRAEARAQALHERRVLRRRRDGQLRCAA